MNSEMRFEIRKTAKVSIRAHSIGVRKEGISMQTPSNDVFVCLGYQLGLNQFSSCPFWVEELEFVSSIVAGHGRNVTHDQVVSVELMDLKGWQRYSLLGPLAASSTICHDDSLPNLSLHLSVSPRFLARPFFSSVSVPGAGGAVGAPSARAAGRAFGFAHGTLGGATGAPRHRGRPGGAGRTRSGRRPV